MARAGLQGRTQLSQGLHSFLMNAKHESVKQVEEAALNAGIRAQDAMEHVVWNTPSSIVPGKSHRVDTGLMVESYDVRVKRSGSQIVIQFGWLGTKRGYFLIQEHGGYGAGHQIAPMHSLMAGLRAARREVEKAGVR